MKYKDKNTIININKKQFIEMFIKINKKEENNKDKINNIIRIILLETTQKVFNILIKNLLKDKK